MNLIKHIFSYSAANIVNAAVPFLLLPILTSYLTPEDYGVLALVQILFALSLPFVLMNIHGLFVIEYSKLSHDEFISFVSTMIWIPVIGFFILEIIFFIFSSFLADLFNIAEKWVLYTPIIVLAQSIPTMIPVLFQAKKEPMNYALFKVLLTILNISFSLLFVVALLQGYEGRLWAIFSSYAVFSLIGLFILYKSGFLKFGISFKMMKDALKFGIPLIPHTLSGALLVMSDRIFLTNMLDTTAVGIYSLAFQLASGVTIIMTSINQAWMPYLYEQLNANPSMYEKREIVLESYKIMGYMFLVTLLFILTIPYIFQIFIDERYYDGINLARYIVIGFMFQGFYFMVTNYIFYVKKTHLLSLITLSSALLLMTLNYLLIPIYGMYGSAYAMIIGWLFLFLFSWNLANKSYNMPWWRMSE